MDDKLARRLLENNILDKQKKDESDIALLQKLTITLPESTPSDGWIAQSNAWSYSSADSPIFVISVNADMTSVIGVGDRIKLTQTTTKYFIVHAVGLYSGGATLITVYGGTDYTLANAAITSPHYSHAKSPLGFPMSPAKWTVATTDTTIYTKTSPTDAAWYSAMDSGSLPSISAPIGLWNASYHAVIRGQVASASSNFCRVGTTLSTSSSSESDAEFNVSNSINAGGDGTGSLVVLFSHNSYAKLLSISSKTTYYLLGMIDVGATPVSLQIQGASYKTVIKLECAYL